MNEKMRKAMNTVFNELRNMPREEFIKEMEACEGLFTEEMFSSVHFSSGLDGRCGCGKPIRYMIRGTEGSCNKYMRCLTYEEMRETLAEANKQVLLLRKALERIAE